MKLFFPSKSQLPPTFESLTNQSELQNRDHSLYEKKDSSPTSTSRVVGYQKPKHLWMAKDQSMSIVNNTSEINNQDSGLCSGSLISNDSRLVSEHLFNSQQGSELTPLRSSYNGMSPSNSSSAAGTFPMPSSLTTTSSSPSNHPSPQNRSTTGIIGGSHYESPNVSCHSQVNLTDASESKPRRRRGRPPKTKGDDSELLDLSVNRKREAQPDPPAPNNYLDPRPSTSTSSLFTGGLKIRLRRDVSVEEPICGKKFRSRKSNQKSVQVFRIVESWCDADAPGGLAAKSSAVSPMSTNQVSGGLRVGDVVWAKLAGYPYWPSKISALYARTPHQVAQVNPENTNTDSLAVSATPADPTLAPGFTAKVEWFAWNQCSYLSCAKLFPFMEYFNKLHNPRTRVKNYAEAVNMAKQFVECSSMKEAQQPKSEELSDAFHKPSTSLSLSTDTDNTQSNMSCPPDLHFAFNPLPDLHHQQQQPSALPCPDLSLPFNPPPSQPFSLAGGGSLGPANLQFPFLNLGGNPEQPWEPLPQLDVSGLNDFTSSVPTFSDDEDESSESMAKQLKSELGSIGL